MTVCFSLDSFILDKDSAYWKVELCDGQIVYQDEGRIEISPWIRLKEHCEQFNLAIRKVWVVFRDHIELVLSEDECLQSEGVFFIRSVSQGFGSKPSHAYVFGCVHDDVIRCKTWKIPEVIEEEVSDRNLTRWEDFIVWNTSISHHKN
jgi:hypothetical protein